MSSRARRLSNPITAWPGYVDALSALLMVVIFVLMIFIIVQFILSQMLHTQENELVKLHNQVNELSELLGLEKEKTAGLTADVERLSDTLTILSEDREALMTQVADYAQKAEADEQQIRKHLLSIASLNEDIMTLQQMRDKLEEQVADLSVTLSARDLDIFVLRDRSKTLAARLADKTERTVLAQEKLDAQDIRIQALTAVLESQKDALEMEKQLSADARAEVALLSDQITRLRSQLDVISKALDVSRNTVETQTKQIEKLGKELNIALARKVNKLEKYRSEFFGRMKAILENNPAVQIQGDRFVFQAGLLFSSGSAHLGEAGQTHLSTLAATLLDVSRKIPGDINWILRIDGHTDRIPIHNEFFSSNWELSAARAVSVVRFLSQQGIPAKRMAAAGFSKYHPIDPSDTPEAYRKNRRIEIKLTSQ
ncbi:MAG: peptidoglycan -binding protein [Desulfobacteraceae bacterium]|nr:MAG: peptidoglycan -binding protein [Desulfobacteraceae bacterium]